MSYIQQIENEAHEAGYNPADRFAGFDRGDLDNPMADDYDQTDKGLGEIGAACFWMDDKYSPSLRATIPGAWILELDSLLPCQSNTPPLKFVGNSRREVIQNTVDMMRTLGYTGTLKLHA